ncbi:MAG: NUDIX hydrolase [Archaeoglobaceae archaeon]
MSKRRRAENTPQVGVGVIIRNDNQVLLGRRKNTHGEGTWSFPGGHLEFNEEIEDCARREVWEEVGISIKNIKHAAFTNDIFHQEEEHYITLFVLCDYDSGEVRVKEPHKCEEWKWFDWNALPRPLFLPIQNLLKQNYEVFCEHQSR